MVWPKDRHAVSNKDMAHRTHKTPWQAVRAVSTIALVGVALSGVPASGQLFTGSIVGTVTDASGGAVANADVAIRNQATNELRHMTTDAAGHYSIPQLLPGTYSLTVTAAGFETFIESGIPLAGSQVTEHDPKLHIGSESQTVNVSAASLSLDTETADRSVLIDSKQLEAYPTSMRNPLFVVNATAGVVAVVGGLSPYMTDQNQNRFALNGGRDESSALLVDGASIVAMGFGGAMATPVMDATESVQVQRTAYDPLYTHSDGAAVSTITKRGTNDTHGSIFEFITNDHLNANTWSNNHFGIARPLYQRNQFGASIGTHIMKDKLFVFGAYEALRQAKPQTWSGVVPTALERVGDFSQSYNTDGSLRVIYDPTTQVANGSGYSRTAFAGNKIPSNMITTIGKNAAALYPLPNIAGAASGTTNWAGSTKVISNYDKFSVRADYVVNAKDSFFVSYLQAWQLNAPALFFHNAGDSNTGENDYRRLAVISNTWVPDATWVVNTLVNYTDWTEDDTTPSAGHSAADYGMAASSVSLFQDPTIFPGFTVENFLPLGASQHSVSPHGGAGLQFNVTKQLRTHNIRFGFLGEQMRFFVNKPSSANFTFNSGFTSGPNAQTDGSNSGSSIASLLIGTGASGDAPYVAKSALQQYNWGWYIADSWRATNRLTLNFGLRYEIQGARTERFNRLNYFSTTAVSPLQVTGLPTLVGGLEFAGVGKNGRGLYQTSMTNFAPRLSFAYQATDRLVLRGGWGLFYPLAYSNSKDVANNSDGFSSDTSWVPSLGGGGLVPQDNLSNPFPNGLVQPSGSSLGLLTQVGQKVNATYYRHPTPYVQVFSTDIQARVMRDTILEVGYVGSLGRQLAYGVFTNLDQLPSQYLASGTTALNASVTNPFYGKITSGTLSKSTIPYWRTLIAYPQFTSVQLTSGNQGSSSNFNAFTAKYNQHWGSNLNLIVTYQFSKALDDSSETNGWEISDQLRDAFNHKLDYGISGHDVPQSVVASLVAGLPIGRGKRFLSNVNPTVNAIIGGWQISNIYRFTSGLPLQFTTNNALSTYNYTVTRPNIVSYEALATGHKTLSNWFNTAAVTSPGNAIGNISRWVGKVRRAPTSESDIALSKTFALPFRQSTFTFRAESYNVSNTPQYAAPDTNLNDGNFGKVTATTNLVPRQIQFSGRINF